MTTPPPHLQNVYLNPETALLDSTAQHLLAHGDSLKSCMVVVPTSNSGRQLRQALPTMAGRAILAPSVVTADTFSAPHKDTKVASKIQWWHAWSTILRRSSEEVLSPLFPNLNGIQRDFRWGLKSAQRFTKLKDEITSVDLGFKQVAEYTNEDAERWRALAFFDQQVKELLHHWQQHCPADAKRYAASHWKAPLGVEKIILAGVSDLPVLAQLALSKTETPVEILIQAHAHDAQHFDYWGRPAPDYWCSKVLPIETSQISVHSDATQACEAVLRDLQQVDSVDLALTVTDRSLDTLMRDKLQQAGWSSFSPEGKPVSKLGLWDFLKRLRKAISQAHSFQDIPNILKAPEARTLLYSLQKPVQLAIEIDQLASRHLPQTFSHAIHHASGHLEETLTELQGLLVTINEGSPARGMELLFDRIERSIDFPQELIDPFIDAIESIKDLEKRNLAPHAAEALDLILASCEGIKVATERAGTVVDQIGWLELPFTREPELKLLGLHETCVPERPHDDGFLPESLRTKIQLYSRQQLEARDSYLLESSIQARTNHGSVSIFVAQSSPNGEERQASRLLMRCGLEELPSRVQHCFPEESEAKPRLPAYHAGDWILKLNQSIEWPSERQLTISPNRLKDYLLCPFRFYLQQVESFKRLEFDTQELDSAQFGTLVHDVLEEFGKSPTLRDLDDVESISSSFSKILDDLFKQRYGDEPSLPLSIQKESALQRLLSFAPQQASFRSEGWRIKHVELAIGLNEEEIPWQLHATPVRMRIDRIDENEHTGEVRVIDYKTSKKAKEPNTEHLEPIRHGDFGEHVLGAPIPPAGKSRLERRWKNLQLPLYAEFVQQYLDLEHLPKLAYISFPAASTDTGIRPWIEYDEALHESAMEWAKNIITAIKHGHFPIRDLPSNARSWDRFSALSTEPLEHVFELAD